MTQPTAPHPLTASRSGGLSGTARLPGDVEIGLRGLILGAVALGATRIAGLPDHADLRATAAALGALGAVVGRGTDGVWQVQGRGVGGLSEPDRVLDLGGSATAASHLAGLLATHPFTAFMTGAPPLTAQPVARVTAALERMGASFVLRAGGRLPGAIIGAGRPVPIVVRPPAASARVKGAVLLAGLNAPGRTTVVEAEPTPDHTERLLRRFGLDVTVEDAGDGALATTVSGHGEATACDLGVPADPTAAAYVAVAALILPGSALRLPGVGTDPRGTALFDMLRAMGGAVVAEGSRVEYGEPRADLLVQGGALTGVEVPPDRLNTLAETLPALAVAAACAVGDTVFRCPGGLRGEIGPRLTRIAAMLTACGVAVTAGEDRVVVHGAGRPPAGGCMIATAEDGADDPGVALAALILGLAAEAPVRLADGGCIAARFPGLVDLLRGLGAAIADG